MLGKEFITYRVLQINWFYILHLFLDLLQLVSKLLQFEFTLLQFGLMLLLFLQIAFTTTHLNMVHESFSFHWQCLCATDPLYLRCSLWLLLTIPLFQFHCKCFSSICVCNKIEQRKNWWITVKAKTWVEWSKWHMDIATTCICYTNNSNCPFKPILDKITIMRHILMESFIQIISFEMGSSVVSWKFSAAPVPTCHNSSRYSTNPPAMTLNSDCTCSSTRCPNAGIPLNVIEFYIC